MLVPAGPCEREYVVKKSRFIARLVPVENRGQVNAAVAQARLDHPDAGHHCWAYLLGKPADASSAGMSDDGEPAGTAGKPILNVLQHGALGNVLVIVIRYFGGVKLGAGGLVRAYGTAAAQVLDIAPAKTLVQRTPLLVCGDFNLEQPLRHLLSGLDAEIQRVDYQEGISMYLQVASADQPALEAFCGAHGARLREVES